MDFRIFVANNTCWLPTVTTALMGKALIANPNMPGAQCHFLAKLELLKSSLFRDIFL
jgi:hypothetical protein